MPRIIIAIIAVQRNAAKRKLGLAAPVATSTTAMMIIGMQQIRKLFNPCIPFGIREQGPSIDNCNLRITCNCSNT